MPLEDWQGRVPPHDWHVLKGGSGPLVVMLHGAGASAESVRPLMERLEENWRVFAPDLPGHGRTRTGARRRSGLYPMAEDIATLVRTEKLPVHAIVGHSAGAAIALASDEHLRPKGHILINAALAPFDGMASLAFPGLARTLRDLPFASSVLASRLARRETIERLLRTNGMDPDEAMIERYMALASSPKHIAGTLAMMGEWSLNRLLRDLPNIGTHVDLVAARSDPVVPLQVSKEAEERLPDAKMTIIDGGHLVHESQPEYVAQVVSELLSKLGKTGENSH